MQGPASDYHPANDASRDWLQSAMDSGQNTSFLSQYAPDPSKDMLSQYATNTGPYAQTSATQTPATQTPTANPSYSAPMNYPTPSTAPPAQNLGTNSMATNTGQGPNLAQDWLANYYTPEQRNAVANAEVGGPGWDPGPTSWNGTADWRQGDTIGGFTNSPWTGADSEANTAPMYAYDPARYLGDYYIQAQDPTMVPQLYQMLNSSLAGRSLPGGSSYGNELFIRQMEAALASAGYGPSWSGAQGLSNVAGLVGGTPSGTNTPPPSGGGGTQGDQLGDPARWAQLMQLPAYQNLDPGVQTSLRTILGF